MSTHRAKSFCKISSSNDFNTLYPEVRRRSRMLLIVYQNANPQSSESELSQLFAKAKCVIPAVRNYLYFNNSQLAVVYFGKRFDPNNGNKIGMSEGAEDFKVKIIRFLTSEVWPPLLRTDAPDESLGTDILDSHDAADPNCLAKESDHDGSSCKSREKAEELQEKEWVKKSLESSMEVLVYLKRAANNTKYMKLILHNNTQRIHFDIVDPREEKFRWEERKLFTRIMDNLESQKAVDSYDSYLSFFRQACEMAAKHAHVLERPTQPMLQAIIFSPDPAFSSLNNTFSLSPSSPCRKDGAVGLLNFDTDKESRLNSEKVAVELVGLSSGVLEDLSNSPSVATSLQDGRDISYSSGFATPDKTGGAKLSRPFSLSSGLHHLFSYPGSPKPYVPVKETVRFEHSDTRFYSWMESLGKPESATLDYKSYMARPDLEIMHRSVKFLCGFLNAYREGKLIIGVHEILRRPVPSTEQEDRGNAFAAAKRDGKNQIVLHNDSVDQFVVGVRMSERELEEVQRNVSEQLLSCVPPIPPVAARIEMVPIRFHPEVNAFSHRLLLLYDLHFSPYNTQDAVRQKCNSAIRFLNPLGIGLVPYQVSKHQCYQLLQDSISVPIENPDNISIELFLLASIKNPADLKKSEWEHALTRALCLSGKRCEHLLIDYSKEILGKMEIPAVYIVEVSIDIKDCNYPPLIAYKGKFFSGWPSIPLWDETTERVRSYPRNYELWNNGASAIDSELGSSSLSSSPNEEDGESPSPSNNFDETTPKSSRVNQIAQRQIKTNSISVKLPASPNGRESGTLGCGVGQEVAISPKKAKKPRVPQFHWYKNRSIAHRILDFIYNRFFVEDILQFRLIHPACDSVFEHFQGTNVVKMIFRTSVGSSMLQMEWSKVSQMQHSLQRWSLTPLPLLYCRVYELLGNLPSPYPYVAVPLHQQSFRLSPDLVPLYCYQSYFDGTMRISVVLDLRDSFIKLVQLRCGELSLNTITGVEFEQITNYKSMVQMKLRREHPIPFTDIASPSELNSQDEVNVDLKKRILVTNERWRDTSMMNSVRFSDGCFTAKREVEMDVPVLSFQFRGSSTCNPSDAKSIGSREHRLSDIPKRQPWSLFTLLNWLRSVLMDSKHVQHFGYCDRSFAFQFLRVEDICSSHFPPTLANRLQNDLVFSFSSEKDCLLHRRQEKWANLH